VRKITTKKGVELLVPEKGEKHAGAGRPKGSKNKMTVALQEAILLAAEKSRRSGGKGLVGYLTNLANDMPKVFGPILGKLMTLQEKQLAKTMQEPAKPVAHMRKSPRR
jgi:hypothetical protein